MTHSGGSTSGARTSQGEYIQISTNGTDWSFLTDDDTTGWTGPYVNYGAYDHAWHTVTYGWSAWLELNDPTPVRYVRFHWDDNYSYPSPAGSEVLAEVELEFEVPDDVEAAISAHGSADILVELFVEDYTPEGNLLETPSLIPDQRTAIASAQSAFQADMPEGNVKFAHQLVSVPLASLNVDLEGAAAVIAHPLVLSISLAIEAWPLLDGTTPMVGAPDAFDDAEVRTPNDWAVAVLDTGVQSSHATFGGRVAAQACFSTAIKAIDTSLCPNGGPSDTSSSDAGEPCSDADGCDHGTHVAGIVAGENEEFTGVDPFAKILAVQVFREVDDENACDEDDTPCLRTSSTDWIPALEWVYEQRDTLDIAAVNMSFGTDVFRTSDCGDLMGADVVFNLKRAGIAVVAGSGNSADEGEEDYLDGIGYPACLPDVVSVGSVKDNDDIVDYSEAAPTLDLLAPGWNVKSSKPGGGYQDSSGTSMAAPHVAGAVALLRTLNPHCSSENVVQHLINQGVSIEDDRSGTTRTFPRLDISGNKRWILLCPPEAPEDLAIGPMTGQTSTELIWTDVSSNETYFQMEVRDSGGQLVSLIDDEVEWNGTEDAETHGLARGLSAGNDYTARVRSCNTSCSDWSESVQFSTVSLSLPGQVQNAAATAVSSTQIDVDWDPPGGSPSPTHYRVTTPMGPGIGWSTVYVTQSSKLYSNLDPDTAYGFWIAACSNDGCSNPVWVGATTDPICVINASAPYSLSYDYPDTGLSWVDGNDPIVAFYEIDLGAGLVSGIAWHGAVAQVTVAPGSGPASVHTDFDPEDHGVGEGTLSYLRVRACCAPGICTGYSNQVSFTP